jgi:hypothetical protein
VIHQTQADTVTVPRRAQGWRLMEGEITLMPITKFMSICTLVIWIVARATDLPSYRSRQLIFSQYSLDENTRSIPCAVLSHYWFALPHAQKTEPRRNL